MKKIIRLTESDLVRIVKQTIKETSLSRIHKHLMSHDCAVVTAYRHELNNCAYDIQFDDKRLNKYQKKDRNKTLKYALEMNGYGVTRVLGTYVENYLTDNAIEVKEESFFVVNLVDDPKFIDYIITLSKVYCQDSVMIMKKGGNNNYLVGTNLAWPGLGKIVKMGDFKPAKEGEFMTKVNDRPFIV